MARAIYREWFVEFRFPGHEDVEMVELDLTTQGINGDFRHIAKIPKGWKLQKLGDLAKRFRRGADPQELPDDTPYIGLGHMPKKSIALNQWGKATETKSRKYQFKRGEILFGRIRPYFHKVGVAPIDGVCSTDIIVISPQKPYLFSIVLGCVSSKMFVDYATQTSSGTKMPRAKWKILVNYPVVLPPQFILERYNELIECIVAQIQNLIHQNIILRQTRDLLLPKLVSGQVDVSELEIEK
jgi:type I restriction enzyme S subunit